MKLRSLFISAGAAGLLLSLAAAAVAQDDQGVPPPARGSQPDACYEDCMWHYVQQNGLVAPQAAAYCDRPGCHPSKYAQNCDDKCNGEYNNCIQSSPEGYAGANGLKCSNGITQCEQTCRAGG